MFPSFQGGIELLCYALTNFIQEVRRSRRVFRQQHEGLARQHPHFAIKMKEVPHVALQVKHIPSRPTVIVHAPQRACPRYPPQPTVTVGHTSQLH